MTRPQSYAKDPRNNESGMALLLVLAITALLAALLSELSFSTLVDLRLAETYRDTTRAYYLAKGGIQVGQMILADDDNGYDSDEELWARGVSNYPVGGNGWVSINITALDGRINLNDLVSTSGNIDAVVKDRCLRLFDILDIDHPESHVDALIDWIDPDDDPQPAGAEAGYYALQNPATACKNGPMDTLEELQLIAGFTEKEIEKLRPHISLYGDKIHLNSATPEVLYALAEEMDLATAEMIVDQRKERPFEKVDDLKELPGWESFYWAINGYVQVKANYYRIDTRAGVNDGERRARATVEKDDNRIVYFEIR
nr:type II secretion system minor pseudopilin GspK [uncultured Desulfuromonas sp.]